MTIPGAGGQVPPRVDQSYTGSGGQATVSPGGGAIVRAREVIVAGTNGGVFAYSSAPPALGNLISSAGLGAAGTDAEGNATLQGTTSYLPGATYSAVNLNGGEINFYTAPGAAGPWTLQGSLVIVLSGSTLVVNFTNLSGAINVPQPAIPVSMPISLPPPSTYSQVYLGTVVAALNDTYALLQSANISL